MPNSHDSHEGLRGKRARREREGESSRAGLESQTESEAPTIRPGKAVSWPLRHGV